MLELELIAHTILCNLYLNYFSLGGQSNIPELAVQAGWNQAAARRVLEELEERNLIQIHTAGGYYQITCLGVAETERLGAAPADALAQNVALRLSILRQLAQLRDARGALAGLDFPELAAKQTVSREHLAWTETHLRELGLIEEFGTASRITRAGLSFLQEHEQRLGIKAEFSRIKELEPAPRGKALERLVGRVFEAQGWSAVTNVKTNNEEIDLIIRHGREYYLVECKWLAEAVETEVVHALFGKLTKRAGTHGLLVSMSGFTRGVDAAVTELSHSHLILLFGPLDIEDLIYDQANLNDLLTQKFDALVMRKRAEHR